MLKRKMTSTLEEWRTTHANDCLFISGARQVGKSYIVEQFGRQEYASYIGIDFIKHPELKDIFAGSLEARDIYERMSLLIPGIRFVEHDTLIFIDEIQECPNARGALKYLAQDGKYDIVASGSLLGIAYRDAEPDSPGRPVSVGYERHVDMHPLDFEEFLWALGINEDAISSLFAHAKTLETIPATINEAYMRHVRTYLAVGGMPAVVQTYVDTHNYSQVHDEQVSLSRAYLDDIAKYARPVDRVKARACYTSLPQQLAKENTKFKYSVVERGGTSRKFGNALDWLREADIIHCCRRVSTPQFPLNAYERPGEFRVYANDTGLLMAMYPFEMKRSVVDNLLVGPMKGGLYENLVACMLACNGAGLHYWMNDSGSQKMEFLVDADNAAIPVEVKAGRGATASLNTLLDNDAVPYGYKLIDGNVGRAGKKVTLPLYLAPALFRKDVG